MKEIEGLPLTKKVDLYHRLGYLIHKERLQTDKKMVAKEYIDIISKLMGIEYNPKSRERDQVIARVILGSTLVRKGYTHSEAGQAIGKDHSTIVHIMRRKRDWESLPFIYEKENKILKQFNELI